MHIVLLRILIDDDFFVALVVWFLYLYLFKLWVLINLTGKIFDG